MGVSSLAWERAWGLQRALERHWRALDERQRGLVVVLSVWMVMVRLWLPLCKYLQGYLLMLLMSTSVVVVVLFLLSQGLLDK